MLISIPTGIVGFSQFFFNCKVQDQSDETVERPYQWTKRVDLEFRSGETTAGGRTGGGGVSELFFMVDISSLDDTVNFEGWKYFWQLLPRLVFHHTVLKRYDRLRNEGYIPLEINQETENQGRITFVS